MAKLRIAGLATISVLGIGFVSLMAPVGEDQQSIWNQLRKQDQPDISRPVRGAVAEFGMTGSNLSEQSTAANAQVLRLAKRQSESIASRSKGERNVRVAENWIGVESGRNESLKPIGAPIRANIEADVDSGTMPLPIGSN